MGFVLRKGAKVQVFLRIDLNLFMAVVCLVVYFSSRNMTEKRLVHNRIFRWMIIVVFSLLILDSLTWVLDGSKHRILFAGDYFITLLLFLLTPIPAALWALYVKSQLFHDAKVLKKDLFLFGIPIFVCALLTLTTPYTNLMFVFDRDSIYHRGFAYPLLAAVALYPVLLSMISILIHRKRLAQRYYYLLLIFSVLIIGSAIMQVLFYGLTIVWSSIAITALLVYTNLQNDQVYLDHLTGVFNRRQMDIHLSDRILLVAAGRPLSCIMLDINRFKTINDTLGHLVGDDALRSAASILKASIRKEDFLSRYGGDEFVILSEIEEEGTLGRLIDRISENARQFNTTEGKPYTIQFSVGYAVYPRGSGINESEFLTNVDRLMYQDKQRLKEEDGASQ